MRISSLAALGVAALSAALAAPANADDAFDRELYRTRLEHEVAFRAAAIQVAWAAEALCDHVTEIEPFVLWSAHALPKRLDDRELENLHLATGMDRQWRVVWLDEGAPDALQLGDVVVAVNGRPLPQASMKLELGALLRGALPLANDDQGFWDVMLKARERAAEDEPMVLTLADGRQLQVPTQTGCAGSVTASAFDLDPDKFWRQGSQRVKLPGTALLAAQDRDEFRWLAAFGTYFQASLAAIEKSAQAEDVANAFVVGKILSVALPGAGMLLTALEAQTEKTLVVDSIVGSADLFANEVVAAMGGDAAAGLRLNRRMLALGAAPEAVQMSEFRRSNADDHARRLRQIQALQDKAWADAERAEQQAQAAVRRALPVPMLTIEQALAQGVGPAPAAVVAAEPASGAGIAGPLR